MNAPTERTECLRDRVVPDRVHSAHQGLGRVLSPGALDRVPVERLLLLDERQTMVVHDKGGPGTTPCAALGREWLNRAR